MRITFSDSLAWRTWHLVLHTKRTTNSCVTNEKRELERNETLLTYSQREVGVNDELSVSESNRNCQTQPPFLSRVGRCGSRGFLKLFNHPTSSSDTE